VVILSGAAKVEKDAAVSWKSWYNSGLWTKPLNNCWLKPWLCPNPSELNWRQNCLIA